MTFGGRGKLGIRQAPPEAIVEKLWHRRRALLPCKAPTIQYTYTQRRNVVSIRMLYSMYIVYIQYIRLVHSKGRVNPQGSRVGVHRGRGRGH